MKYIILSIDEAKKVAKKDAKVMIAISDLENGEELNSEFKRTTFGECYNIFDEAKTIAKVCDDFANQLRVFTKSQIDVINYEMKGKLSTILLGE